MSDDFTRCRSINPYSGNRCERRNHTGQHGTRSGEDWYDGFPVLLDADGSVDPSQTINGVHIRDTGGVGE